MTGLDCEPGTREGRGLIAACGPEYDLIITPSGCEASTVEPMCSGQDVVELPWGSRGVLRGVPDRLDGRRNTASLMQFVAVEGIGAHPAAEYCANLVFDGHDDWYLPAVEELQAVVASNRQPLDFSRSRYMTSTESGANDMCHVFIETNVTVICSGAQAQKNDLHHVRCLRRTVPEPEPADEVGYFVLSERTFTGDLGGLSGAHALCLEELQSRDWMGKRDASDRGLLTGDIVEAFLCLSAGVCGSAFADTTYAFARADAPDVGGARFHTNDNGRGPGDDAIWSGLEYFAGSARYWTNRDALEPEPYWWGGGRSMVESSTCTGFTLADPAQTSVAGTANASAETRWGGVEIACDQQNRIICLVHPR